MVGQISSTPSTRMIEEFSSYNRAAQSYLGSNIFDVSATQLHITNLSTAKARLNPEIERRSTDYPNELSRSERSELDLIKAEIGKDAALERVHQIRSANQDRFERLRLINGGGFPRNVPVLLYLAPLLLIGIAEWYVNYSTFAQLFVPFFAIASTIIVGVVFAWASHLHGSYIKQIAEITHPSVEYRNMLGRRIAVGVGTVLLVLAFTSVVWLRWMVISEQIGSSLGGGENVFGSESQTSLVWAKVAPTVIVNFLIWGVGTLYAWALHERVPDLRESYSALQSSQKLTDKLSGPYYQREKQIAAKFDRERSSNSHAIVELKALLSEVEITLERLTQGAARDGINKQG